MYYESAFSLSDVLFAPNTSSCSEVRDADRGCRLVRYLMESKARLLDRDVLFER